MRILAVEDEKKMAKFLKKGLVEAGYVVDLAETAGAAESLASEMDFDLVILDIMLPDQNGLDAARHLRRDGYKGPILFLTALADTKTKVTGLDAGADDYLTKPFSFEELLARIRALLRRRSDVGVGTELQFADLKLNLLTRKVYRGDREVSLTAKEFTLLEFMVRHANEVLSRTRILEHVWEMHFDSNTNVIDVHVNTLRKKIEKEGESKLIHTVIGMGYVIKEN